MAVADPSLFHAILSLDIQILRLAEYRVAH